MDMIDKAFEHTATEIDVVSEALEASHTECEKRLNELLRAHPRIVKEADREFAAHGTPHVSSFQQEIHVRSQNNNRPPRRVFNNQD